MKNSSSKQNVEHIIRSSINKLAESMPGLAEKVVNEGYFISTAVLLDGTPTGKPYLFVDFTLKANELHYSQYDKYTKQLMYYFKAFEHWYEV